MKKEHVLVKVDEIGDGNMVDELNSAYLDSCHHNEVDPSNMEYFREYMFTTSALIITRMRDLEKEVENLTSKWD